MTGALFFGGGPYSYFLINSRNGYIIYVAQCKMKMQGPLSIIIKNFKTVTADQVQHMPTA